MPHPYVSVAIVHCPRKLAVMFIPGSDSMEAHDWS